MPFTDAMSSMSGRNSRSSNISAMTGASRSLRSGAHQTGPATNDMFSNTAVLSMLKTSTDTGDIGALSFNTQRLPTMPRMAHQRRGHFHRPSGSSHHYPPTTSSHHYAPSQTSRISDSTSFARKGSMTSMQSMPPPLPPFASGKGPLQMPAPTFDRSRDSRSYSMTSAPAAAPLPRHHSSTSLKSAGHMPRRGPAMQPHHAPPLPDNRPPYVYPTRLKRPGYRSPSPALSELSAQGSYAPGFGNGPHHPMMGSNIPLPHATRRPQPAMQRPAMPTYNSDYGPYTSEPAVHSRPRPGGGPRYASPFEARHDPHAFGYRPGPMRSDPVTYGTRISPRNRRGPVPTARGGEYRAAQNGPANDATRPGYSTHLPVQDYGSPVRHRGQTPPSVTAHAALSMFHNAAHLARHMPVRTDTPMSDPGAASSDPPSSSTAPTSSSPATPKDRTVTHSHVEVDPLFIEPALTDLTGSTSEPVLPAKYFEYVDGLAMTIFDSTDLDVPHPSVPPAGFVQRVRAMLESKVAVDAPTLAGEHDRSGFHSGFSAGGMLDSGASEIHELPANETPRITVIEEFDAPAELPASPIKIAELSSSPPDGRHRLTRELIKAELGPSSTTDESGPRGATPTLTVTDISTVTRTLPDSRSHSPDDRIDNRGHGGEHYRAAEVAEFAADSPPSAYSADVTEHELHDGGVGNITLSSEETQSRDPFILDADTITMEHQRSRGRSHEDCNDHHERLDTEQSNVQTHSTAHSVAAKKDLVPDAPAKSVDDSMQEDVDSSMENAQVTGTGTSLIASSDEASPPSTPRTPRTYSKSVQLRPTIVTTAESPNTNRYSLPHDFSTLADTSLQSGSEMVTDIAIRFSLPTTTISVSKPQIITIPPSSPDREASPMPATKPQHLGPHSARRHSVSFAEHVVPVGNKSAKPTVSIPVERDSGHGHGRSILRHTLPSQSISEPPYQQLDNVEDSRQSNVNGVNRGFGSTHLPGLKEESIEDISVSDQHYASNTSNTDGFPLPARIAAVKAMQERRLQESADKAKARRAARQHNRPLGETRDLPSLNFSRMDLIDKLNEALEMRPVRSMELVRRRHISPIYCPSPQRPQSTDRLRERYASFFSKPEHFVDFDDPEAEAGENGVKVPEGADGIPVVEIQESTGIEDREQPNSRAMSPEDLLNVATQVNRLSIPSVAGLSERLTSLLPSLRNLHLDSVLATDEEVAHTIEDIQHLGHGGELTRPGTVLSNRTSAGFRTLAERAEEFIKHGTHDSCGPPTRPLLTDKELPPLPESASADQVSSLTSVGGKQSYLSGSMSVPADLGKEPSRPCSALIRQRSPTTEDEVRGLLPPEMNPIMRSKRSMIISSASRPWNQDESYPWNGADVAIDLTVPSEAHTRDSTLADFCCIGKHHDKTTAGDRTASSLGIDIGSITTVTELRRSASITTEQATGISTLHLRKASRRSIIGSLSRKMGIGKSANAEDTTRSVPSPLLKDGDSLPYKSGDRYPTTALTPPLGFNVNDVRSFFSDNSSERQRHPSFRKRFTNFKTKSKPVRLESGRATSLEGRRTSYDADSINADRLGSASAARAYDGACAGRPELGMKRFGLRLRHLFAKGGELISSFSTKSRQQQRTERLREDWLSDSLYSGA